KDDGSKALETVAGALEEASQEILRAGAIIKRMRNFVSRGDLERSTEKPETLARDACALVAGIAKLRSIDCSLTVTEKASAILVDRVQIQQVLLNLLRNAIDAIGDAGEISIEVETDDKIVRFTVSDNGPGVPAERVARLFDPFSTTKSDGMGM